MGRLEFSPEQRESLGLRADESVRLVVSGSRTVVLERLGADAAEVLPWDRELVLSADVGSFPLADILQLLHVSSKSGFLLFENGDHTKTVYLHRGEVVFATSNQRYDRLGESLVRCGALTAEQLEQAEQSHLPLKQFGKTLVERGFLTSRELWDGVKKQVEEIVRSLFAYAAGRVAYWEGEITPDNVVRLALPSRRLIAEGLRRRDDLIKLLAWLEGPQVTVEAVADLGVRLEGTERAMYEAIVAGGTFQDQCQRAGVEPLCGARTIQHLRLLDAVSVIRSTKSESSAEAPVCQGDDDAVRDCVRSFVKLLGEFAAPIVAVEGEAGLRERFQQAIADTSQRYPELLDALSVGQGALVDPDELIRRALIYPGEREREVRLALSELTSYLKFELMNHPKIPCPDVFLEGLEELRAEI